MNDALWMYIIPVQDVLLAYASRLVVDVTFL